MKLENHRDRSIFFYKIKLNSFKHKRKGINQYLNKKQLMLKERYQAQVPNISFKSLGMSS